MQKQYGDRHFNFISQTFVMPAEYNLWKAEATKMKKIEGPMTVWIAKPKNLSRGRGIRLLLNSSDLSKDGEGIEVVQR